MNAGRLTLFDSPFFLGFDHFEKTFERMRKSAGEGYPPYNIEQIDENGLRITLAVAGFPAAALEIETGNNQLFIRGRHMEEDHAEKRVYLHRGIAARQFQRSFVLADGIVVRGATLDNGLLHIALERIVPEAKTRKIEIGLGGNQAGPGPRQLNVAEKAENRQAAPKGIPENSDEFCC